MNYQFGNFCFLCENEVWNIWVSIKRKKIGEKKCFEKKSLNKWINKNETVEVDESDAKKSAYVSVAKS